MRQSREPNDPPKPVINLPLVFEILVRRLILVKRKEQA